MKRRPVSRRAYPCSESRITSSGRVGALSRLGTVALHMAEYEQAIDWLEPLADLMREIGNINYLGYALEYWGHAFVGPGDSAARLRKFLDPVNLTLNPKNYLPLSDPIRGFSQPGRAKGATLPDCSVKPTSNAAWITRSSFRMNCSAMPAWQKSCAVSWERQYSPTPGKRA